MFLRPIRQIALGLVGLFFFTLAADGKWRHYRSANFELYADGPRGRAEAALNYLEQVREVFGKISNAGPDNGRPVRVVAFASEADFKKLKGRGESVYAFYAQRRERNYIVFQELDSNLMYEVAVHEYVHLRVSELGFVLPLWLNEGLAELYSTMHPQKSSVRVGMPPKTYPYKERLHRWPVSELVSADLSDPKLRRDHNKVSGLYLRSWAMVSMLLLTEEYRERFDELFLAIVAGEKAEDAFAQAYGRTLKEVNKDLDRHLSSRTVPVMSFETSWDQEKRPLEVRDVDDLEAELVVLDLMATTGHADEARQGFSALVSAHPDSAEAWRGVARLAVDDDAALEAYARAAELGADNPYLFLDYARKILDQQEPDIERAKSLLRKAADSPDAPDEARLLLTAFAERDGDLPNAVLGLRLIRRVDPAQAFAHHLWLARLNKQLGAELQAGIAAGRAKQAVKTARQLAVFEKLLDDNARDPFETIDRLESEGKSDEAEALLVRIAQAHPLVWQTYERLAARAEGEERSKLEETARTMRWQAAADGRRGLNRTMYHVSLLDQARMHEASQHFFEALIDLTPRPGPLLNNRAYELANRGYLLDAAVDMAERAVALNPESDAVKDTLGWAYLKAGRAEDAAKLMREVVESRPKDPLLLYHYGAALAGAGRTAEALEAFDNALAAKPSERLRKQIETARLEAAGE